MTLSEALILFARWAVTGCGIGLIALSVWRVSYQTIEFYSAIYLTVVGIVLVLVTAKPLLGEHTLDRISWKSPFGDLDARFAKVAEKAQGAEKVALIAEEVALKAEEAARNAEDAVRRVRGVMATLGAEAIISMVTGGRWGGNNSKDVFLRERRVMEAMAAQDVPDEDVSDIKRVIRPYVIHDYVHWISDLAGAGRPPETNEPWKEFFTVHQFESPPLPEAYRAFLQGIGVMDEELDEWLKDYQHFFDTGEHRRPRMFMDRDELLRISRERRIRAAKADGR